MSAPHPTLHLICGKIAAGKSTLAARLAKEDRTVLISEDVWLGALFADQMRTGADYVLYSARLRQVMGPHIIALLKAGTSVVLDFPANTLDNRAWMRALIHESGTAHQLHVMTASDETCLARLRARNASGEHPFAVTEEQFYKFSKHYVAPGPDEGFTLVMHDG